jgi:hypothetical protein
MNPFATCWRTALALVLAAGLAQAEIPPETVDAVVKQHQDSVLYLSGTVRYLCAKCTREHQFRVMSTVVVVDVRGLMVARANGPLADPEVELRGVNLQVRLPDGAEVPVRVALTDQDLGVMILALEKPQAAERLRLRSLTLDAVARVRVLDPLLVLRRHDQATGYALSTASVQVHALETSPRRLFFSTGLGRNQALSPCFDATGRLVALTLGDQTAVSVDELADLIAQVQPATTDLPAAP